MHFIARSQALKTLLSTLPNTLSSALLIALDDTPSLLDYMLPSTLTNALKHTPGYPLKYSSN